MSKKVGVRELKNQTSSILKAVREEMAEYIVTVHGEPIAILRPITDQDRQRIKKKELAAALAKLDELADEITKAWQSEKTAVELVDEQRR